METATLAFTKAVQTPHGNIDLITCCIVITGNKSKGHTAFSRHTQCFYLGYLAGENLKGRARTGGSKLFEITPCSTGL